MNALSNSNARDAIDRAEEIVNKVEELGFVKVCFERCQIVLNHLTSSMTHDFLAEYCIV